MYEFPEQRHGSCSPPPPNQTARLHIPEVHDLNNYSIEDLNHQEKIFLKKRVKFVSFIAAFCVIQ
jgi:hypothetical protein